MNIPSKEGEDGTNPSPEDTVEPREEQVSSEVGLPPHLSGPAPFPRPSYYIIAFVAGRRPASGLCFLLRRSA